MRRRYYEGVFFAVLAALCFGLITPLLAWSQGDLPPLTVSALLSVGMAVAGCFSAAFGGNGPTIRGGPVGRILASATLGAVLAPAMLAYGVARASGFASCLLLNLEPVICALLGVAMYGERIGWRFAAGTFAIVASATRLMSDGASDHDSFLGLVAVGLATALWALDNAITRPLAVYDSSQIMVAKGLSAFVMLLPAMFVIEGAPVLGQEALEVAACGFFGYGGMERAYLMAQRSLGVARTSSIFAIAPFFGAAAALMGGAPAPSAGLWIGLAMAVGVYLHASDSYREIGDPAGERPTAT